MKPFLPCHTQACLCLGGAFGRELLCDPKEELELGRCARMMGMEQMRDPQKDSHEEGEMQTGWPWCARGTRKELLGQLRYGSDSTAVC